MPGNGTNAGDTSADPGLIRWLWRAYRLRWKRRYFLARAIRRKGQLTKTSDRRRAMDRDHILLFSVMRNEALRLPHFLDYYRGLGIGHFLVVDNGSDDETAELLAAQPDVSLWSTQGSYKAARFGLDWLTWLHFRNGHGHWCLTVDADELLTFPHAETAGLGGLTAWLDARAIPAMGAVMIDLYPQGPLGEGRYRPGDDPLDHLRWYDADNFFEVPRPELGSTILRGGVRLRAFFADQPERAPTMNKVPLVRWRWRYAYLTSTHVILPPALNRTDMHEAPSGALLHTKFLPDAPARAAEEKQRGEHFSNSPLYDDYYDKLAAGVPLWSKNSQPYRGWQDLARQGLISAGGFAGPEKGPEKDGNP